MAYSPEDFAGDTGVSRETLDRLRRFADELEKWQPTVNLVSSRSLGELWHRHMLDSAQLLPHAPPRPKDRDPVWVDIGSGAGFPGLVVAIMGAGEVHLVERRQRKCAFLIEASRISAAGAIVHRAAVEDLEPWPADIVTSRACAPLPRLLDLAAPFVAANSRCLFLKGQDVEFELTEASKCWSMDYELHPSRTDPSGAVLEIRGLCRV